MFKNLIMLVATFGLAATAHAADPAPATSAPATPAPAPATSVTPAAANPNTTNPYLQNVPPREPLMTMPKGTGSLKNAVPWQMSKMPSAAEKKRLMKTMIPHLKSMGLNIRDIMNYMTTKYQAKPGVTFDEVVESMKLRANQLNLKLVGHSPLIKDIQAVLGDTTTPRMEVFHFCDIAAGREIMKLSPESIVFLPCRIAVMEDDQKNVWVLTLDWDTAWLEGLDTPSFGVSAEISKMAKDIRDRMDNVMQAGANGDL
jgi:uncharacterized protein (DUF302 family)